MISSESGEAGLFYIAQKVGFVAWAYEYQAGSDVVLLGKRPTSSLSHRPGPVPQPG